MFVFCPFGRLPNPAAVGIGEVANLVVRQKDNLSALTEVSHLRITLLIGCYESGREHKIVTTTDTYLSKMFILQLMNHSDADCLRSTYFS